MLHGDKDAHSLRKIRNIDHKFSLPTVGKKSNVSHHQPQKYAALPSFTSQVLWPTAHEIQSPHAEIRNGYQTHPESYVYSDRRTVMRD